MGVHPHVCIRFDPMCKPHGVLSILAMAQVAYTFVLHLVSSFNLSFFTLQELRDRAPLAPDQVKEKLRREFVSRNSSGKWYLCHTPPGDKHAQAEILY